MRSVRNIKKKENIAIMMGSKIFSLVEFLGF
jgi:hypothetical protein